MDIVIKPIKNPMFSKVRFFHSYFFRGSNGISHFVFSLMDLATPGGLETSCVSIGQCAVMIRKEKYNSLEGCITIEEKVPNN